MMGWGWCCVIVTLSVGALFLCLADTSGTDFGLGRYSSRFLCLS